MTGAYERGNQRWWLGGAEGRERTTDDVFAIAGESAPIPRRSIDEVLELVLHVEVRYPRWSGGRELEVGCFFVVGRRFGRRRGEGEVADAAIVLVDDECAVNAEASAMENG